jgi:hypothetical protein
MQYFHDDRPPHSQHYLWKRFEHDGAFAIEQTKKEFEGKT